jgi:hypothetical protein
MNNPDIFICEIIEMNKMKHKITKCSLMVLTIAVLGATALIINPAKIVYAQGNESNVTKVIDVDTLSKNIQERHPILAQMSADEDKDLIAKIKDLDAKEAVNTLIVLDMLRLLQQYKEVDIS